MEPLLDRLDQQLQDDCHLIAQRGELFILLHRNALVPWFILVPLHAQRDYTELFQVPQPLRESLMQASDLLSGYLMRRFQASKLNLAAIGNLVPQFHWHVIGRRTDDPLWPAPVWGNLGDRFQAWQEDNLQIVRQEVERLVDILPDGNADGS